MGDGDIAAVLPLCHVIFGGAATASNRIRLTVPVDLGSGVIEAASLGTGDACEACP